MLAKDASHAKTSANSFSKDVLFSLFNASLSSCSSSFSHLKVASMPLSLSLFMYKCSIIFWNSQICIYVTGVCMYLLSVLNP